MRVKVILIEPKYQVNLGYAARTAKNFGLGKMYVVNPRTNLRGKKARMYAKHAYELLEDARVYRSLDEATRDCDVLVGTTGIMQKAKANFKRIYLADDAVSRLKRMRGDVRVGLLVGRDDTGLNGEEIEKCDMLAYIGTNPDYPVLNVSHALAIFLYLLRHEELRAYSDEGMRAKRPESGEMQTLLALFGRMISGKHIRNKRAVLGVFRRMLRNTQPSSQELHALITALK